MEFAGDFGDGYERWCRGMPQPDFHFTALREDFFVYVVGSVMRFVEIDLLSQENKVHVVKSFKHGFDGISILESDPYKEVYAIAEKTVSPRVQIYQVDETKKDHYHQKIVANLTGIQATEIRAMRFNRKEIIVILTGYPTFSLSIWKWTMEQELMVALCNEPSEFSDLLINPLNDFHWIEYGRQHMTFYDLQSFTKNDVIRTQIYLPQRLVSYDVEDPGMGQEFAMSIVSACFTNFGDFYVLDNQLGLHILNQEDKVLTWLCSIGFGYLGTLITRIVPFGDCIAEIHDDGWVLGYDIDNLSGKLILKQSYKLSSNVLKYFQFPGYPDSFYAITEKEGLIEGVEEGTLREPFCIPDFLFSYVRGLAFVEPTADYCAVLSDSGKICILNANTGEMIEKWKLPYRVACIISHPILPFMFCGTGYGCVNVLDIQNLKVPKLVSRNYLSKEKQAFFSKMAFVAQGKYLVVGDANNDRLFLQYGYPFEEFEYLDSVRVPGEIRVLNVPGCGANDCRLQVLVYAKYRIEEICPTYVYMYDLSNGRLQLTSAQYIMDPIKTMCFAPMKDCLYTYHADRKQLGITPIPKNNNNPDFPQPDIFIQGKFESDLNKMIFQGDKLYTFGEDGVVSVYTAPVDTTDVDDQAAQLKLLLSIQTHSLVDRGIAEGFVSMDGSQIFAVGYDGTFTRIQLARTSEPDWTTLGFIKPRLYEFQMASYTRDQERWKTGKERKTHIELIRSLPEEDEELIPNPDQSLAEFRASFRRRSSMATDNRSRQKDKKGSKKSDDHEGWVCNEWSPGASSSVMHHNRESRVTTDSTSHPHHHHHHHHHKHDHEHRCIDWLPPPSADMSIPEDNDEEEEGEDRTAEDDKKPKRRSDIRRQLEEEAEKLRAAARGKSSYVDDEESITEEDIKVLMDHPNKEVSEHNADQPETSKTTMKTKKSKKKGVKNKYKNVQSKIKMGTNQERPSIMDDDNDGRISFQFFGDDDDDISTRGSIRKRSRSKRKSRKSMKPRSNRKSVIPGSGNASESDREMAKKGQFSEAPANEDMESYSFGKNSDPSDKEFHKMTKKRMMETVTVVVVSHAVKRDELTASELWSKFEQIIISRQSRPIVAGLRNIFVKFETILRKLMDMFKNISTISKEPESTWDVDIMEFNVDNEIDIKKKIRGYVKYCDISVQARDNVRQRKIDMLRKMMWDDYIYKGKTFVGLGIPTVVSNYPIKTREDTFGDDVVQCEEERRLELKIESAENELLELCNNYTLQILKSDMESVDKDDTKDYLMRIMSLDISVDDLQKKETKDEESIRSVLQDLDAMTSKHSMGNKNKSHTGIHKKDTLHHHDAKRSTHSKHGIHDQRQSHLHHPHNDPRQSELHHNDDPRQSQYLQSNQRQSHRGDARQSHRGDARQSHRGDSRQSEFQSDPRQSQFQQGVPRGTLVRSADKRKSTHKPFGGKTKGRSIAFNHGDTTGEDTGDEDYEDETHSHSSHLPSKKSLIQTIKPNKAYMPYRGLFGPKGGYRKQRMETIFDPSSDTYSKRNKRRLYNKKKKTRTERMSEVGGGRRSTRENDELVIESEDDEDAEEEEGWEDVDDEDTFIELKNAKLATMDEQQLTPYLNVQRVFSGDAISELEDMYQYKPNPFRYHQLELKARHHIVREIWLMAEEAYRLKRFFDEMFKEATTHKKEVMQRMKTRNERIREILHYLQIDLDIKDESVDSREQPHKTFFISSEEIPVEKYESPFLKEAERLAMEEAALLAEKEAAAAALLLEAAAEEDNNEGEEEENEEENEGEEEEGNNEEEEGASLEGGEEGEEEEDGTMEGVVSASDFDEETTGSSVTVEQQTKGVQTEQVEAANAGTGVAESEPTLVVGIVSSFGTFKPDRLSKSGNDEEEEEEGDGSEETRECGEGDGEEDECKGSEEGTGEEEEDEEEDLNPLKYLLSPGEKTEALLLKEIPKPEFMLEKEVESYTQEEVDAATKYLDDCEELERQKAGITDQLQEELHQLYKTNANDYHSVNLRLKEMLMAKMKIHFNVALEECGMMRLVRLMRVTDDCIQEEERVNSMLAKLQDDMKSIQTLAAQLTVKTNDCKEKIQHIIDKQNDLERRFHKELGDVGNYLGFFLKNYRRKPKIIAKNLDKNEVYETGIQALKSANMRNFGRKNGEAAAAVVNAVLDIESSMLMPAGCPKGHWDRFNKLRRKRLVCDFEIKANQLEMEYISEGLEECKEREQMTAKAMAAVLAILSHRAESRAYMLTNTEFQFVTGKGNVEINFWDLAEHANATMILSSTVEKLNSKVNSGTDKYIRDIKKCIHVHRDIRDVEWRFLAARRTRQDLKELLHDASVIKPKKELLRALEKDQDLHEVNEQRKVRVKNAIEKMQQYHKSYMKAREKMRRSYQRRIKRYETTNEELKECLKKEAQELTVFEHENITETPAEKAARLRERASKFISKGFMLRKIQDNNQTIRFLEKELTKYYQKSYPCL